MQITALIAALFLPLPAAASEPDHPGPRAGDVYEMRLDRETKFKSDDSEGSSTDRDSLIERVIAARDGGLELEYDLPAVATAEDRARVWQLPARILKPSDGPMRLLNAAELEARMEIWLKAAKYERSACGRWIFTWNTFQIQCDPQSVIEWARAYDLGPAGLRDGAMYKVRGALAPKPLTRKSAGPDGATYVAELAVDPDSVRREQAEADVVVGEVSGNPVTLKAALRERAKATVSGTIMITIETDGAGNPRRRTKVTKLQITDPDGKAETRTATETLSRRLISRSP